MPSYRRPRGSPDFSAPNGPRRAYYGLGIGQKEALTGGALMAAKSGIRPLVAGNWKMNGLAASLGEARRVRERLGQADFAPGVDVMICPPATLIGALARDAAGSRLLVGGQDCHRSASGAHTGDISAEMLKDAGAGAVIVGHSERRADHGERSADVQAKALGGASRRPDGHRVHRRDCRRAQSRAHACRGDAPTRRLAARKGRLPPIPSSPTSRSGPSAPD